MNHDTITFGPVHLDVTNAERSAQFWETLFGFKRRNSDGTVIELGTSSETLIAVHGGAREPYQTGYSGLYHVAIHTPDQRDFARLLKRFSDLRYPASPTDHTFSKAIYLDDPDGINIEVTLETPERYLGCKPGAGNRLIFMGADGNEYPGGYPLDLEEIFQSYVPGSEMEPAPDGTKVGHIHLYVADLMLSRAFYEGLGFEIERWWPPMQVADFGAGGPFKHRIAINTWHGTGALPSPKGTARMREFEIRYETQKQLDAVLSVNQEASAEEGGWRVVDPAGNAIKLALRTAK